MREAVEAGNYGELSPRRDEITGQFRTMREDGVCIEPEVASRRERTHPPALIPRAYLAATLYEANVLKLLE